MILSATGHRPSSFPCGYKEDHPWINDRRELLKNKLVKVKPDCVLSGFALGWDQIVVEECIKLHIPFKAYIPFKGQHKHWPQQSQKKYEKLIGYAQEIIVVADKYSYQAYKDRNKCLVDDSDEIWALYDNSKPNSGTGHCIRYAQQKGLTIVNFWSIDKV